MKGKRGLNPPAENEGAGGGRGKTFLFDFHSLLSALRGRMAGVKKKGSGDVEPNY